MNCEAAAARSSAQVLRSAGRGRPVALAGALAVCLAVAGLSSAASQTAAPASSKEAVMLDQGWSEEMRQLYYFTPQGSRLMPLSWFMALERTDGPGRFADPEHLKRFGFIRHEKQSDLNPAGLPIGFAVDPASAPEGRWIGFTCAACHTGEVEFKGKRVRIDGGPANLDFDRFYAAVAAAVRATALDPGPTPLDWGPRFERFASAVLSPGAAKEDKGKLRAALAVFEARLSGEAAMRHPAFPSGFGRVDALNQIMNALAVRDLGVPENLRPVDAPTSYPQLWVAPKLDWVQWNPVASNPMARNLGEVLGVFGAAELRPGPTQFQSTALIPNLFAMENWLDELKSPRWPEKELGLPFDKAKAQMGKALFDRDCRGCHNMPPFRMTEKGDYIAGKQFIKVTRVPAGKVGTDMGYIRSFLSRTTATGPLASGLFEDKPLVPGGTFFVKGVGEVTKAGMSALKPELKPEQKLAFSGFRFKPVAAPGEEPKAYDPQTPPCERLDCLKPPTLLGVWATGPFLHNGSVPNLYELLSPPAKRSKVFWVGGRELDTRKLGFVSTEKPGLFRYDTTQPGNGNGGHAFPQPGYSEKERMAVIEYLKDPNRFAPEPHH
jgi:cytochrome c2